MDFERLEIPEVVLFRPKKFGDSRGFFSETFNANAMQDAGFDLDFVQDNHSFSAPASVLRGLHYQKAPFAQDKLVRCSRGSILDVAVDIRKGSPTFGKYVSAVLSADNWSQLLIPIGFAHGLLTLEPNTEVQYKVTNFYSPECDANIRWDDPDIGIDWGVSADLLTLSEKDAVAPLLSEIDSGFEYVSNP